MILWNTVSAVKQPVRGLSPDEMAVAEAVGREGEADLEAWTRSISSSAWPGTICAMWNTRRSMTAGNRSRPWVRSRIVALQALQWCRTFHTQPTLTPLLQCTDLSLVDSLVPIFSAIVHMKGPAVKLNHQEEGQSEDPHLGYELMITLQTFRFLHTTINAWTGGEVAGKPVDSTSQGVRNL